MPSPPLHSQHLQERLTHGSCNNRVFCQCPYCCTMHTRSTIHCNTIPFPRPPKPHACTGAVHGRINVSGPSAITIKSRRKKVVVRRTVAQTPCISDVTSGARIFLYHIEATPDRLSDMGFAGRRIGCSDAVLQPKDVLFRVAGMLKKERGCTLRFRLSLL